MRKLFPTDIPSLKWMEFEAAGFSRPVSGLIHRSDGAPICGMPLGAIDTGCLDLEGNGTFGFCTIFNSHVPRRGPLNLPFLGISVGSESWVLTSQKLKAYPVAKPETLGLRQAKSAREIHYWGHYPVADLEYETDAPVSVGLRAWSPFIPGDVAISNTPGAVFEVHLRNTTDSTQNGKVAFSFPGPSPQEVCGLTNFTRMPIDSRSVSGFSGVVVTNESGIGYALGVIGKEEVRTGAELGVDGGAWSGIVTGLPVWVNQAGASVATDFELKPKEERLVHFVLAWYSPQWKGEGTPMGEGNTYTHMYASRFKSPPEAAQLLSEQHELILKRILAWQQAIYTEKQLPVWLRESLVNILHLITEDSFWAQAKRPIGEWCKPEDGLFGLNESPRVCPQIECIPCSFYGNIPLVYFFPELALSTLRGYKAYQYPDGAAPWIFGGVTGNPRTPPCEMATPCRGYAKKPQTPLDGPCYVDMVERLWLRTGNPAILTEFYPSVKKNTIFTMNLRPEAGPAGVVSMPTGNTAQDWFEHCDLFGIVPHIGGVHLANLRMAERMAEEMGDKEFAEQCRNWFNRGRQVMEEQTWTGEYYLLYHEPATGKTSDVIMGYQLDGEWMAKFHGLPAAFRLNHIKMTLATLRRTNTSERGAIVFRLKKEGEFEPGYWSSSGIHVPGSLMLAMTYMYHGELDFGLELARRTMHALIVENRCSWDSSLVFRSDTGEKLVGNDYYQNMMLWALPAAAEGMDLAGPCTPGGLVDRIIHAGNDT